ncbi:TonB-dependent receptor [Olivibacter sp. SDN3]|uniref:TonB-dependent receptor n=1 Tax=Olivibacter sp. SDN3 TaxID=2764720 RepID=UPI001C9E28C6|nr:carboxypeptidase regulatory-like domain-containing protein [Olivibacter sp. SDN3]
MHTWSQGTEATITGKVLEKEGPIAGASITVRNESTGFKATTVTNEKGNYTFQQLPLGSPYTVTANSIGFTEQRKTGFALNFGDEIVVDFELAASSNELEEVVIEGSDLRNTIKTLGASTAVTATELTKLPVNGRNFSSLIDLSPVSSGSNLAGQRASSTNYTVDGMTSRSTIAGGNSGGAYAISMEAIREFKVVTNEYDVTYGRSGGGSITTVTKSGTNTFSGSAFTFARTDWLSSNYNLNGTPRAQEFSTYQYGFALGGPIVKDKAHFFVAWDHQADARPLLIADIQSQEDIGRYRVTQESLDEFTRIAREKYGFNSDALFGSFDKRKATDAAFARIDWQIHPKHLLTIRNNFIYDMDDQQEGDNSGINAFESYVNRKNVNNSLMASLRSSLSSRLTNDLKIQHFYESTDVMHNVAGIGQNQSIPRVIVENVESVDGDRTLYNSIQMGGQRFAPEWFKGNVFQLVNNLYYNTEKIKYTFGADIMYTDMNFRYGSEMNGRFYFTGLENFDNMTPYRYARDVYMTDHENTKVNNLAAGVYGQMETRLAYGLDVVAGIRLDNTSYLRKANFNQVVYDELGIATDNGINTFQFQPRVQFNWNIGDKGRDIIRFGAGIFGSNLNPYSMLNNMLFDGSRIAGVDITDARLMPPIDFASYRNDPNTAPGRDLLNNPEIEQLVTINTNSPDVKVPTVYKANISINHFFTPTLRIGFSAYGTWGRNNYMYVDRNMVDEPYFRIAAEDNRGVYVPANTIQTANGTANWVNSRKTENIGRVLEMNSEGKVNSYTFVVDGTYRYYKDGQINVSYTWNDTRDNTSYNGNVANTATLSLMVRDDPRDLSTMTYSDNQFRHKVVFYGNAPSVWGITMGLRFSGISGTRYSLAVAGNMNGDFVSSNDLAYIYDPGNPNTPEYLREGINAILNNPEAEQSVKDYINANLDKIAERNGGENGFYGVFDLRLAKMFRIYGSHGIEASVDIFNLANMLNKDWGVGRNLGNQNIYSIRSFDPEDLQYEYNVNAPTGVSNLNGNPFQVQLGLRYAF